MHIYGEMIKRVREHIRLIIKSPQAEQPEQEEEIGVLMQDKERGKKRERDGTKAL